MLLPRVSFFYREGYAIFLSRSDLTEHLFLYSDRGVDSQLQSTAISILRKEMERMRQGRDVSVQFMSKAVKGYPFKEDSQNANSLATFLE